MENSKYIQRLLKPYKGLSDNPFSFGGGLKNGGIDEESMNQIRKIFRFDYMGSAEFEYGKVPETLNKMVENKLDLISGSFKTKYKYDEFGNRNVEPIEGSSKIYYICFKENKDEVKKRIKRWALGRGWKETKEAVLLDYSMSIGTDKEYSNDPFGWLELDNGFMFFLDKEMYEKSCQLFGVLPRIVKNTNNK